MVCGDSRLAGSSTTPMGALSPSSSSELGGDRRIPHDVARLGLDPEPHASVAGGLQQVVQGVPQIRPCRLIDVVRMGTPHILGVSRPGTERDDIGAEARDESDQPDGLGSLPSAQALGRDG